MKSEYCDALSRYFREQGTPDPRHFCEQMHFDRILIADEKDRIKDERTKPGRINILLEILSFKSDDAFYCLDNMLKHFCDKSPRFYLDVNRNQNRSGPLELQYNPRDEKAEIAELIGIEISKYKRATEYQQINYYNERSTRNAPDSKWELSSFNFVNNFPNGFPQKDLAQYITRYLTFACGLNPSQDILSFDQELGKLQSRHIRSTFFSCGRLDEELRKVRYICLFVAQSGASAGFYYTDYEADYYCAKRARLSAATRGNEITQGLIKKLEAQFIRNELPGLCRLFPQALEYHNHDYNNHLVDVIPRTISVADAVGTAEPTIKRSKSLAAIRKMGSKVQNFFVGANKRDRNLPQMIEEPHPQSWIYPNEVN